MRKWADDTTPSAPIGICRRTTRSPKNVSLKKRAWIIREDYTRDAPWRLTTSCSRSHGWALAHRSAVKLPYHTGRASSGRGRRSPVSIGTRIVTGSDGHMQLLLLDETVFTIGPNSDIVVDEFVYDPDTSVA